MSSLTHIEKRYLEKILGMHSGYVLNFSDHTFGEFFDQYNIDIHDIKYQAFGTSKANKLRAFWKLEPDRKVGTVLSYMLNYYKEECNIDGKEMDLDKRLLEKVRTIIRRLNGQALSPHFATTEDEFLAREFTIPDLQRLPLDAQFVSIIKARLTEAHAVLQVDAYLSTIFLCGSILEAVLLGSAQRDPEAFNRARATPKANDGNPKCFHKWSLAQLIDVACEIGVLKPDIKKFSHGLRDFRNYIHPHAQMKAGFTPDEHTAKICFQVLKAALACVAGERG